MMTMLSTTARRCSGAVRSQGSKRWLSVIPQVPERRPGEAGAGGHSSVAGMKVAVFGAGGMLGHYVSYELGSNGYLGYFANRGDDMEMRNIKTMFDLGRARFVFYSPKDVDSIREVIADADAVINLAGKYWETGRPVPVSKFPYFKYQMNFTFADTNVHLARTIAEVCAEMQVDHLIHVSSAAAKPDSGSEWARTKYEGELAVKDAFPWATIIRPTQMFAYEDRFLNHIGQIAKFYNVAWLVNGGQALTQPVWAADVGTTIVNILDKPTLFEGKYVDCFGPDDFTYEELAKFVFDITEQTPWMVSLPKDYFKRLAYLFQWNRAPMGPPLVTPDLVELWSEDYLPAMTAEEYKAQEEEGRIYTMEDLGVNATPLEKLAFQYLHRFRLGGHFARVQGYH